MAFYICGRLGSKSVLGNFGQFRSLASSVRYAPAALPNMTIKKYEPPKNEHFDDKNARLKRPLSPHLTIYRFPMPAYLSITHRASGIILSTYATVLGIGALVLPHDVSHYITIIEGLNLSPAVLFLAKFAIAAPFSYHFVNGIRHLYWDTAKGLTMKEVYTTGYAILGGTLALTIFLASL